MKKSENSAILSILFAIITVAVSAFLLKHVTVFSGKVYILACVGLFVLLLMLSLGISSFSGGMLSALFVLTNYFTMGVGRRRFL